ncbi:basic proline-rich protein-like [Pteronotus mesoamericanus]|uniref:basic proline-rich protein-like n=1 Tax=Pteronotus mesoamericanus TaxID=1884717 RepID=UPI0023EAA5B0|nr:basic proline-rich protein-like [Pteronotus parnellii mesoamericanus]
MSVNSQESCPLPLGSQKYGRCAYGGSGTFPCLLRQNPTPCPPSPSTARMRSPMVPHRSQVCRGQPGAPPPGWATGISGELSARPHPAAGHGERRGPSRFLVPCPARGSVTLSPRPSCHGATPASGYRPVPPPGPPPQQTRAPSLLSGPPPLLAARRASSARRPSAVPRTPCPAHPPSSPLLSIAEMVSHTACQCPLIPRPPTGRSLTDGPLGPGCIFYPRPPAGAPLPTIAPPSGRPAHGPRGQEPPPQGTPQRLRCQTPAVRRDLIVVGSGYR